MPQPDTESLNVNPYEAATHVSESEHRVLVPPLAGPIHLSGEMSRESAIEAFSDQELAKGCLILLVPAFVFVVIFFLLIPRQATFRFGAPVVICGLMAWLYYRIRVESRGVAATERAIAALPSLIGTVRGEINEQGWELYLGDTRIQFGWFPSLRLAVNPRGVVVRPLGIPLPASLFGERWEEVQAQFKVGDQLLAKYENHQPAYTGTPLHELPSERLAADLEFRGAATYRDYRLLEIRRWWTARPIEWFYRLLFLLMLAALFLFDRGGRGDILFSPAFSLLPLILLAGIVLRSSVAFLQGVFGKFWVYLSVCGVVRENGILLVSPSSSLETTWENISIVQATKDRIRLKPSVFARDWILSQAMFATAEQWAVARDRILTACGD